MKQKRPPNTHITNDFDAIRIGSEFIAGVLVGLLIGYSVDQYFGSKPWGIILFLLLGIAASLRFVYRAMSRETNQPLDNTKLNQKND